MKLTNPQGHYLNILHNLISLKSLEIWKLWVQFTPFSNKTGIKQERQCTYNVTLRRVRAAIVAMEKQLVLHNLSVCL